MEKITFWEAVGRMWKNIFNFKGTAGIKEYWYPVAMHIAVGAAELALVLIAGSQASGSTALWVVIYVLGAYLLVSLLPLLSLTVRRLHDTGRKGWWAALSLAVGIGTVILCVFCSQVSAQFAPWNNQAVCVYGPPEWFESSKYDPEESIPEPVYGPPESEYDPANDEPIDVYGPPEWFEGSSETEPYEPEEDLPEPLYGPPAGEIPEETK